MQLNKLTVAMPDDPIHALFLSELLSAKLCHDLAGPIGALNNGVEFLKEGADDGVGLAAEATDLLAMSALEARAKLQIFRQAYGVINEPGQVPLEELKQLLNDFFTYSKTSVEWNGDATEIPSPTRRLLLNIILLANTTLPLGGTITVYVDAEKRRTFCKIRAAGDKIRFAPEVDDILKGKSDRSAITTHTAQPYLLHLLALAGNTVLKHREEENSIAFEADIPNPKLSSE